MRFSTIANKRPQLRLYDDCAGKVVLFIKGTMVLFYHRLSLPPSPLKNCLNLYNVTKINWSIDKSLRKPASESKMKMRYLFAWNHNLVKSDPVVCVEKRHFIFENVAEQVLVTEQSGFIRNLSVYDYSHADCEIVKRANCRLQHDVVCFGLVPEVHR